MPKITKFFKILQTNSEDEDNYSTLRELLIRPSQKSNGSRTPSPANYVNSGNGSSTGVTNNCNYVDSNGIQVKTEVPDDEMTGTGGVSDVKVKKEIKNESEDDISSKRVTLNRLLQKIPWMENNKVFSTRFMTYSLSKTMYPNVPHEWLNEGKLLHLLDSENTDNYLIFQVIDFIYLILYCGSCYFCSMFY